MFKRNRRVGSNVGIMEADLSYFDSRRVSTPDGPDGDGPDARVSILGEEGKLTAKPFGCSTLYECFQHGMKVGTDWL